MTMLSWFGGRTEAFPIGPHEALTCRQGWVYNLPVFTDSLEDEMICSVGKEFA